MIAHTVIIQFFMYWIKVLQYVIDYSNKIISFFVLVVESIRNTQDNLRLRLRDGELRAF